MVSDFVKKQVEDIREQNFKRLQELSILVLLITFAFFIYSPSTFYGAINLSVLDLLSLSVAAAVSVFSLGTMSYFWRSLLNKPQFHVLFIEREDNQEQNNDRRFFMRDLIPIVGITTGLSSLGLFVSPVLVYYSMNHLYPFYVGHSGITTYLIVLIVFLMFSLIVGTCITVLLYLVYRNKPESVQRNLRWLLLIPIFLLIPVIGEMVWKGVLYRYQFVLYSTKPPVMAPLLTLGTNILFLVSFILLFYFAYHINAEYGKFYTFAKEEHLQGFIEEGVGILPKSVHIGDSHSISLDLKLSEDFTSCDNLCKSSDYLEAELQAVGLLFDGEKRLRISETSPLPVTTWNCRFAESGTHTINLMLYLVKPPRSRDLIFTQVYHVKVRSFLGVSLAPVLALVVPILAAVIQALLT